jgi:hypothetical protein
MRMAGMVDGVVVWKYGAGSWALTACRALGSDPYDRDRAAEETFAKAVRLRRARVGGDPAPGPLAEVNSSDVLRMRPSTER